MLVSSRLKAFVRQFDPKLSQPFNRAMSVSNPLLSHMIMSDTRNEGYEIDSSAHQSEQELVDCSPSHICHTK